MELIHLLKYLIIDMDSESKPYKILINAQSGQAKALEKDVFQEHVAKSGLDVEHIDFSSSDDFQDALKDAIASDSPLLIGGGDGTISMATALSLEHKKAFGILPFGTMNMIAQDLSIPLDIPDMLAAYKNSKTIEIDIGMINDHPFLCCISLGVMPEASKIREETRDLPEIISMPRLAAYVFQALDKNNKRRLSLTIDNLRKNISTTALVVSNNQYALQDSLLEQNKFKKESLQDGVLGIYSAVPENSWAKIRFLSRLGLGDWNRDPSLKRYQGQRVEIKTHNPQELVSIDGEPLELQTANLASNSERTSD